ncbi:nuclear envelope pore membrane protein POM 121 isoform X2 [Cuculus canorus]|uniref:nuclear envelope pore membrane protein POM 121 isoform X2 n=1 Tax=Cuculus canorus TaxID=55661 RepID=UPI0023AA61BD|nr:nuclear envelope pore membrane protein POM 121 isoform X2 [Cuculus canorus]
MPGRRRAGSVVLMAGPGRGRAAAAAVAAVAAAVALAVSLPWLVLRGALLGAAALGATRLWGAMRTATPAPLRKAAANGGPAGPVRVQRGEPRASGALHRRYPLPPARSPVSLSLPATCWSGRSPSSTPWARRAAPLRSPITVRIARPAASLTRSPALEHLTSPLAFPATSSPDPCAKETVLNAIKESRKRAVEQEEEEEEDRAFENDQDSKRRRHDSSGSGQSAFEPLVANGAPASLIPKPGSLKRGLVPHCPDEYSNKRSRTSSVSSLNNTYTGGIPSSIRNAIASSYSSSRGLSQLWKRSGMSISPLSSPASSRPQTPEWPLKKAREEELHRSNASTPVKSDKELQTEKVVETPVQKRQNSLSPPSASGSSGKRKRKIQLLSSRRGDQLALPPPPQLGYSVTSEDLDAEKKAALQWFNKVLEDKADVIPSTTAETTPTPRPLAFPVISPTPSSTAPAPASTNSLLDSLKKMQSSQAAPAPTDSTGAAAASQPPSSALQLPAPAVSLESSSLPATADDTKPVLSVPAPAAPLALGTQPPSSTAPPAFTELGQTPSKPPSFPKPSILFGMLSTPPASQPAATTTTTVPTTTAAVPTTAPVFKPIFGALPKSESTAPCAAVVTATVTVSASSGPPLTSSSTTVFKPIFGSVTTASSPSKASPFAFKPTPQPASVPDLPAATTTALAGFTGLPNVIFTTAATTAATQSSSTDATIKPVFSFGLNPPTSSSPAASLAVTTATSTSAAQPFLFGGPASSAPSAETSFATPGPVFQFGKTPTATVTATTSVPGGPAFGQAPSNSTAPTTTVGFNIFGGTTLTSSTPATTGQVTLTFGSSISAFSSSFNASAKPPPPYPGAASQPSFNTGAAESQPSTTKPAAGPVSFGPPFSFGAAAAQPTVQPAFGSSAQPAFGTASAQGSFGTSSTQAAFGTTTSVFSFGTATSTTVSFGSTTQTTTSSSSTAVFGTTPAPFTFGAAAQPGPSANTFGIGTPALSSGSPAVAFNFGTGQSGAAPAAALFGSSLTQSALGVQNQSTPFAFTVPSTPDSKSVFGGTHAPSFGQSTPVPGAVGSSSGSLSFGTPSTPAAGFGAVGTSFGSSTPTFSIGAGSKTGSRQRLQARRQHPRKK